MTTIAPFQSIAAVETAAVVDACLRLDIPLRIAPAGLRPLTPGTRLAGRVAPARHAGSVDVFLEAIHMAHDGDVLVIDNQGRTDEACIGDLTALEAQASRLGGIVVWGLHRDTRQLREIDMPIFSYGAFPAGPRRLDARNDRALSSAGFGDCDVSARDVVIADDDGAVFVPEARAGEAMEAAQQILQTERTQAAGVTRGQTLYQQLRYQEFLDARGADVSLTFRQHLRSLGGEIEE